MLAWYPDILVLPDLAISILVPAYWFRLRGILQSKHSERLNCGASETSEFFSGYGKANLTILKVTTFLNEISPALCFSTRYL
jgi:hypothetical protein